MMKIFFKHSTCTSFFLIIDFIITVSNNVNFFYVCRFSLFDGFVFTPFGENGEPLRIECKTDAQG